MSLELRNVVGWLRFASRHYLRSALWLVVVAATVGLYSGAAAAYAALRTELVAADRASDGAFFVTPVGELYRLRGTGMVTSAGALLRQDGGPLRWPTGIASFTRWRGAWVVADGSNTLRLFSVSGRLLRTVIVPIRVIGVTATKHELWVVNLTARDARSQIWRSTDGEHFTPFTEGRPASRFTSPASNMAILKASQDDDSVYEVSLVGPPVLHRVYPSARRADIALAYSRSAARASMEQVYGLTESVTDYSLPARDLTPITGGVVVLRNREDVRLGTKGGLRLLKGQRADRYDEQGRQLATATFDRPVNWIAAVNGKWVTGVAVSGEVVTATWGPPISGEVIQR
jgi:hypothetical protein